MFWHNLASSAGVALHGANLTWVVVVAVIALLALGVAGVLVREVLAASQGSQGAGIHGEVVRMSCCCVGFHK